MKFNYILQINEFKDIDYKISKNNILKVTVRDKDSENKEVILYDLNFIEKDKIYPLYEYISSIETIDNEIVIGLIQFADNDTEFLEIAQKDIEVIKEINDDNAILIEEIVFPDNERSSDSNNDLLTKFTELENKLIEERKRNEKQQLEMLELMMGLI